MSLLLSSFIRACKILIMSIACSFLLLVFQLIQVNHTSVFHITVFVILLVCLGADTYQFSSRFSDKGDTIFGLIFPMFFCLGLSILGYFCFPEVLFDFLFLPLRAFEEFGFLSLHSILMADTLWIFTVFLLNRIGYMHPVVMDDDYFEN